MSDNEYMREYLKEKYDARRAYVLNALGNSCSCGATENLNATPGKGANASFNLSRKLNNANWEVILSELQHYSLLCASCLAKRTKGVEHGGGNSGVRNCPCAPCKAKKSEYMKLKSEQYNSARKAKRAKLREEV